MEKRLERIRSLIKDESITIKSDELYSNLLDAISQEKFDLHVEAIKSMASDGHKYVLETVKDTDGFLSLKVYDETTGKTSEDAEKSAPEVVPENTPEVTPEPENKNTEPNKEPEPESKKEPEPEAKKAEEIPAVPVAPVAPATPASEVKAEDILELKNQMAKLLEAVSGGSTKVEAFKADIDSRFTQFTDSLTDLKKKTKDLQDAQYVSKQLGLNGNNPRPTHKKSLETDIWAGLIPDNLKQ